MESVIIIAILAVIVVINILYFRRTKKHKGKCTGCPYSNQCGNINNSICDSAKTEVSLERLQ
jgi:hypothetical protein